ncbi:MAG: permease, partial [Microcystaceae cyanobacterium]
MSQIFLSLPFLVAGILLSSALLVFVDEHKLVARFPRSRVLASIVGSALGLLLPIGQLGAIPLVR